MAQKYSIQLLTATTAEWNESQYVIPKGELVAEVLTDGKIQLKVGNGLHKFSDLAYVASSSTQGGSGAPGYSPTVSVVKVDNTATITITDKEGDHTFCINDGESPTIDTEEIDGGYRLVINDANGESTFDVINAPDAEMSDESTNAVQNWAIKAYIDGLIGDIESAVATINTIIGGE
jgi:hypothetical protein